MPDLCLLPQPRRLEYLDGVFRPVASGTQFIYLDIKHSASLLQTGRIVQLALQKMIPALELTAFRGEASHAVAVLVEIDTLAVENREGYILHIDREAISIVAHDLAGAFYAAMTLRQIARQTAQDEGLPCLRIVDWPDFPNRGVMLDISRDKVPSIPTLHRIVDLLAEWKINQFQLYTEHTFAYRAHASVWRDASPMTGEEILALDRYCRERFIELVPNQNSFGHMERWLKHPEYVHMAEAPGGFVDPWGNRRGAYGLCPTEPASLEFLSGLYDELLPHFSSLAFNVGCDETFDLGKGRSQAACEKQGTGRVYLDFLLKIHALAAKQNRKIQFWGDIVMHHPELIRELPRDTVALEWGYEASHPFAADGEKFAEAGIPYYVCPGTSAWNSIAGRTENAIENIRNAAVNGLAHGATGLLNTDWGDNGHWQHLPVSYLGYACGAAAAWNANAFSSLDVARAQSLHAFEDETEESGRMAFNLGNAYKQTGALPPNNSMLALLLQRLDTPLADACKIGLTQHGLEQTLEWIEYAMDGLPGMRARGAGSELIRSEFENGANLMKHACKLGLARFKNPGPAEALPAPVRRELAGDLEKIIGEYRQIWLQRNRPGGLPESAGRLNELLARYTRNK